MWLLGSCSTDDPNQPTEWRCNSPIACLRCDTHTSFSPRCNLVWGIASFASQRPPYARPHTDPASSLRALFCAIIVIQFLWSLLFCFSFFFAKLLLWTSAGGEGDLPRFSRVEHSDHEMWWRGSTSHAVVVAMLISMGQAPAALFVKQARGAEAMHSPTPASAVKRLRAGLPLPGKIYAEQGNGQPPTWSIGSVADASGRPRCSHCPLFVLPLSAVAASTVSSAATRILYPGRSPLLRAMERGKLCVATQRLGTWPLLHAHSRFRMAASRDGGGAREETSAEAIMKAAKRH